MAYIVGAGIADGRSAATRAALGVTFGVVLFVAAVAAGLGAVIAHHPGVLTGLEIFGALYLAWLAYSTFSDARKAAPAPVAVKEHHSWFRRGLIVNLTNPKVMLFFLAFLPQFLGHASSATLQLLMLGMVFQLVGLVIDMAIGWSAGSFRDKVLAKPRALHALTYTSAAVFIVLAGVVGIEAIRTLTR